MTLSSSFEKCVARLSSTIGEIDTLGNESNSADEGAHRLTGELGADIDTLQISPHEDMHEYYPLPMHWLTHLRMPYSHPRSKSP